MPDYGAGFAELAKTDNEAWKALNRILELDIRCEQLKREGYSPSPMPMRSGGLWTPKFARNINEIEAVTEGMGQLAASRFGGDSAEWARWLSYNIQALAPVLSASASPSSQRRLQHVGRPYDAKQFEPGSEYHSDEDDIPPRCRSCGSENITFEVIRGTRYWMCGDCGRHSSNAARYDPAMASKPMPGCTPGVLLIVIAVLAGIVVFYWVGKLF